MTAFRIRSTDGSNSDDGSTWALSKLNLTGFASAAAAGDIAYVSQAHAETQASALSIAIPGTISAPCRIIGSNDSADPPTALSTAPTVSTTGASNIQLTGSAYVRGVNFVCGAAAANFANFRINYTGGHFQWYDTVDFTLQDTHPSGQLIIGSGTAGEATRTRLDNCRLKLSNTSQSIVLHGPVQFNGGSLISGTSTPTAGLIILGGVSKDGDIEFNRFDFSNLSSSAHLVIDPPDSANAKCGRLFLNRCTLPASWTGNFVNGTVEIATFHAEMRNCQISGGAKIRMWLVKCGGSVRDETTVVRTGGAEDDGTAFAMKIVSLARCTKDSPLECPPIKVYNETVGSVSYTIELTHSSVGSGTGGALTDADFFVDAVYPGGFATTRVSNPLSAPADLTSSSETWASISSQLKQKVTITFSPGEAGDIIIKPHFGKASVTAYYCPKVA